MRKRSILLFLVVLSMPVMAGPKIYTVAAGKLKGQPELEGEKASGYYIWLDKEGLHVRWTAKDKPLLFTGRLDTDRPIKTIERIRKLAGGWARSHGNRIVLYSSTVRPGDIDGFDLTVAGGRKVELILDIDGEPPTAEQVFLGKNEKHPKGVPLRLRLR